MKEDNEERWGGGKLVKMKTTRPELKNESISGQNEGK